MYIFSKATIMTEMDELCYIRNHNTAKHTKWEATDKGIIFIEGVWENSHMVSTTSSLNLHDSVQFYWSRFSLMYDHHFYF